MSDRPFRCRSCGAADPTPVLSLGRTPLANGLLTPAELDRPEATYPLELVFCPDCTLVQITETVPPEELFREYVYQSSFSDTMLAHAEAMSRRLVAERGLGPRSRVVEIASNDGYLLQFYRQAGIPVLGVEPAANIAQVAEAERGIPTIPEFFSLALAERLVSGGTRADVIHANNVLAHVADLNGVVAGIERLLEPEGVAVIEVPSARDMIDHVEFDTIYHEHLCYFSLTALDELFSRHGLVIVDVEHLDIHGGSLRITAEPLAAAGTIAPAVRAMLDEERRVGMDRADYYRSFTDRVRLLRERLGETLRELKEQGRSIAVYGASAKGSTLLNSIEIGDGVLDFVADRSHVKQGRFTPGTRLPIVGPEALVERMPDYVLLLTWNFRDEIMAQQAEYRRRGGRFIVPLPELEIL